MREWLRRRNQARRALDCMTPARWVLAVAALVIAWLVFVPAAEAGSFQIALAAATGRRETAKRTEGDR